MLEGFAIESAFRYQISVRDQPLCEITIQLLRDPFLLGSELKCGEGAVERTHRHEGKHQYGTEPGE